MGKCLSSRLMERSEFSLPIFLFCAQNCSIALRLAPQVLMRWWSANPQACPAAAHATNLLLLLPWGVGVCGSVSDCLWVPPCMLQAPSPRQYAEAGPSASQHSDFAALCLFCPSFIGCWVKESRVPISSLCVIPCQWAPNETKLPYAQCVLSLGSGGLSSGCCNKIGKRGCLRNRHLFLTF